MTGDKGIIRHRERASQQIDFSGLLYHSTATPSNIDGVLELSDRLFVWLEYKHATAAPMAKGQRVLLERVTDAVAATGRCSASIIAIHSAAPPDDIDGANASVSEVRYNGEWIDAADKGYTVKTCVDRLYAYAFGNPLDT